MKNFLNLACEVHTIFHTLYKLSFTPSGSAVMNPKESNNSSCCFCFGCLFICVTDFMNSKYILTFFLYKQTWERGGKTKSPQCNGFDIYFRMTSSHFGFSIPKAGITVQFPLQLVSQCWRETNPLYVTLCSLGLQLAIISKISAIVAKNQPTSTLYSGCKLQKL